MRAVPRWWREHFLGAELALVAIVTGSLVFYAERYGFRTVIERFLDNQRGAMYGTLASILGSLLGFVITTVSIVIAFASHERLEVIRSSRHYATLWKVFMSGIKVLGFGTLATLAALLCDRDASPRTELVYGVFFFTLLAGARLGRCVWVLERVIDIVTGGGRAGR